MAEEKGEHLHRPEGPTPGEIIGVEERGERRKWGDKLVRKIRSGLIKKGLPAKELEPVLSRFNTASTQETKDPTWLERRKEELEGLIGSGKLAGVELTGAQSLLKEVKKRESRLERERVKEELEIPPKKGRVEYKKIETPEWVKKHLIKELKTIPQSGRKPKRDAEVLVQMARNEIVKIEAANQPFREADYNRLAGHKDEIHQFLRSTAKTEDKERILWLRYELEARERLQRYWQAAWYGPEGIGKMIKWAKEHSREMLEEHYAALFSIPEVVNGLCLKGYHSEMELSGFQRVGYHLRRLGGTCMFKDAVEPGFRKLVPLKDLPGFELYDIPENLRTYLVEKVGEGTSFEFSLYRTMHALPWARSFHRREEWERLLELKTDLEGRPILDKDGKPTIINHGEWGYTYDMWHDPGKVKFYRWNWDRIGEDNRERLSKEVELDGKKVVLANMSGRELNNLPDEQKEIVDKAIEKKLKELCKTHDDALNLETIEWTKIFSSYEYFSRRVTEMPDDYLTNWLVNANYMERTQENFLGGGGYLTLAVDKESPSFATLKEALYGKGEAGGSFEHLSLPDRDLEESYWFQELSDIYFPAIKLFRARKKLETSKLVNDLLLEGLDMAYSKELVFKACGIVDKDGIPVKNWATISRNRLTPSERARLILHHLPERAILGTYLAEFGIGWEEFVAYAGWKIRDGEILSLEDALDERERTLKKEELTETEKNDVRKKFESIKGPTLTSERRKEIRNIIEEKFSILQKKHLDKIIDRAIDFYLGWLLRSENVEENLQIFMEETGIRDEELIRGLRGNRARRWGPQFDLWVRERAFWLLKRRAMLYAVGSGKRRPILGESGEPGLDRIAVMMMGHGERDPGGADRLPPLYLHFDVNRYLYSRLAHWSAGYWAQASRERNIDWNRWKLWRLVFNPEKLDKILTTLYSMEYISMEEREGFAQVLGCDPHDQVPSFTRERKGFLIPDIEGKLTPEVTAKETMEGILNIAAATAPPIATGLKALPIVPNSWKEFKAMFRNSVTAATLTYMLTPPTLAGLAATGFFGLASWIASNDFGDENRVLSPLGLLTTRGGHIGPFWFGREQKRQPETLMHGNTPAWDDIIDERVVTEWMDKANQLLGDQPVGE